MNYRRNVKTYEVMDITPDEASFVLDNLNNSNRNIDMSRVNMLVEDMVNGNFKDNGDVLRFDKYGQLLDGQHRLYAAMKSKTILKNIGVIMGLEPDVMDTIDRGKKRSVGDVAKLLGYKNAYNVTAMAALHAQYDRGDFLFSTHVSMSDIEEYLKKYNDLYNYSLGKQRKMVSSGFRVASWFGMILALCYQYDAKKTDEFAEGLVSGGNLDIKDPRLMFRNYMYKTKARLDNYTKPYFIQTLIRTANKFFNGETVADIVFYPSRDIPRELFFTNVLTKEQAISISGTFKKRIEKREELREKAR